MNKTIGSLAVIPNVIVNTFWSSSTNSAYCNYDNNAAKATEYGRVKDTGFTHWPSSNTVTFGSGVGGQN